VTYELIDSVSLNTIGSYEDLAEAFDAWESADPPQDLVLAAFDDVGTCTGARVHGGGA
jgi:hypothetical protein